MIAWPDSPRHVHLVFHDASLAITLATEGLTVRRSSTFGTNSTFVGSDHTQSTAGENAYVDDLAEIQLEMRQLFGALCHHACTDPQGLIFGDWQVWKNEVQTGTHPSSFARRRTNYTDETRYVFEVELDGRVHYVYQCLESGIREVDVYVEVEVKLENGRSSLDYEQTNTSSEILAVSGEEVVRGAERKYDATAPLPVHKRVSQIGLLTIAAS